MGKENKRSSAIWMIGIFACLSLVCDIFVVSKLVLGMDAGRSYRIFLAISLFLVALEEFLHYAAWRTGKEKKWGEEGLYYSWAFLAAAIATFVLPSTTGLFVIGPAIYICTLLAKRVVCLIKNRKVYNIAGQIIFILIYTLILIFFFAMLGEDIERWPFVIGVVWIMLMFSAIVNICFVAFSKINLTVILRIIKKTYAAEILLGLILLMISFSLVFMIIEPGFGNFFDGLWYCFALVTTIGFGDLTATTAIGRVLSVLLGIYGIIVVAVLTSIIVNFYNEIRGKDDDSDDEKSDKTNDDEQSDEVGDNEQADETSDGEDKKDEDEKQEEIKDDNQDDSVKDEGETDTKI